MTRPARLSPLTRAMTLSLPARYLAVSLTVPDWTNIELKPCCCPPYTGRPRPNVTWYLDNAVIDESFDQRADGKTINHLSYPNIGRQHLNARLVCVASNTNLTPPNNKVVILDVNRRFTNLYMCICICSSIIRNRLAVKPVAVHILTKDRFVSADRTYDIECKSSGSKPPALISWWKSNKQLKKLTKNVSFQKSNHIFYKYKPFLK